MMDAESWIVFAAFAVGVGIFLIAAVARALPPKGGGAMAAEIDGPPQLPKPSGRWKVSSSIYNGYDLVMMGFLLAVYSKGVILGFWGKGGEEELELGAVQILAAIVMQFFMVGLVTAFVVWRKDPAGWLGLWWREWPLAAVIAPAAVAATWAFMFTLDQVGVVSWLQDFIGADGKQAAVRALEETEDLRVLVLMGVLAVVVAPVTEEILFRGYLYPAAKRFCGLVPAILSTALIFSVAHDNAVALLPLFFLAVLLTLAYEWTGSIWAPVAIHVLFNGATVGVQLAIRYGWIEAPAI